MRFMAFGRTQRDWRCSRKTAGGCGGTRTEESRTTGETIPVYPSHHPKAHSALKAASGVGSTRTLIASRESGLRWWGVCGTVKDATGRLDTRSPLPFLA